jgi:hypothetical protein
MESFYRWYAEQGCPTPNPDYSWTPNVTKAREKAEATISSESDSDFYYSDCLDSAKAPDPAPTNAPKSGSSAPEACEPKTCRKEETSQSETTTDINKGEAKRGAAGGIEDP